jgi:hypothetical protein
VRVGFVLRSTEIKPLYFDLFHSNQHISGVVDFPLKIYHRLLPPPTYYCCSLQVV